MWAYSQEFADQYINGGPIVTRAQVLNKGVAVATFETVSGRVTCNGTDPIRRRASVEIVDEDGSLTPTAATDLFTPLVNELRLWRGYLYGRDGQPELKPIFTGAITNTDVVDSPDGVTIKVDGYDRAEQVQRRKFSLPYTVNTGQNFAKAIETLVRSRISLRPDEVFLAETPFVTPQKVFGLNEDNDPWKAAQDLAGSIGHMLFFDAMGVMKLEPYPSFTGQPSWEYVEGESATILTVQKNMNIEDIYSHWIVVGQSSQSMDAPVRAEAFDDDPDSDTYYLGEFGDVPYTWRSSETITQQQAQEGANWLKATMLGRAEQVRFSIVPNPCHEEFDLVYVRRGKTKVDSFYVLDEFTIPLGSEEPMPVVTRKRRITV